MKMLKLNLILASFLAIFSFGLMAGTAAAALKDDVRCGVNQASGVDCADQSNAGRSLSTTIKNIINVFSAIIAIIAVIMIMVGGFRYVASAGNDQAIQAAKNTIMYAIIGLVIVALAQIIVQFVLKETTGATPRSPSPSASPPNPPPTCLPSDPSCNP